MSRRGFKAVREFSCPNHPGGPPTLPADGYEREELTIEEAFEPDEVIALRAVVAGARICELDREADTVEAMLGLCCAGHKWKIVGFRAITRSEETVASFAALLSTCRVALDSPHILLAELADVEVRAGHPIPIRIPLIGEGVGIHGEPVSSTIADEGPLPPLDSSDPRFGSGIEIIRRVDKTSPDG